MTSSLPILENKTAHLTFKESSTYYKPDTNIDLTQKCLPLQCIYQKHSLTDALFKNGTCKETTILASFLVYLWIIRSVIKEYIC